MSKLHFRIVVFVLAFAVNTHSSAVTRHALIIAIGNYPASGGWPQLSSARDAEFIKTTLRKHDFQERDITTIADGAATVKGISAAFEQLIKNVQPGDVVVIHFSCHGEQVKAADAQKPGGLDQCVVTYNALIPKLSKDFEHDQAEYYRGQTIGQYLLALRSRLGKNGDVMVLMDYCHSGAGTRGIGRKRGGEAPFVPRGYAYKSSDKQHSSDLYSSGLKARGNEDGLATFVAISATRPEEFDLETTDDNGVDIGSLTYAVSKSFEQLEPTTTYRSLFAKIQSTMNEKVPVQHPLIEGNGLDRTLFGGNFVPQKPYVEIDQFGADNQLTLKSGVLAGLDSGAEIMIYKSGTTDPAKSTPVASGKVISAATFSSIAQIDKPTRLNQPADGWAFITSPCYRIKPVCIQIASAGTVKSGSRVFAGKEIEAITNSLGTLPLVSLAGKPELLIVKGVTDDSVLNAADGSLVATIRDMARDPKKLNEMIQEYARYKFLKEIDLKNEDANVTVKLVPVINGLMDTNNIKRKLVGGVYEFHNHDSLKLIIKNNGKSDVYVNILDLQPDGKINAILPNKSIRNPIYPTGLQIKAGEERWFAQYNITISPPFGTEVFKVFVSKEEIDMEGLATKGEARARGGGVTTRGNLSAMERMVKIADGIATRGATGYNSETADGSTYNIVYRILP